MKVVIAAAGQGTRMLHLAKNKPKHLIRVKNRPFLAYLLDNILEAGYKDIILVVGHKGELFGEFLEKYKYKATIVNQFDVLGGKDKIYGTACPLMCVEKIMGKEQFVFICGDNLYSPEDLREIGKSDEYVYAAGLANEHPEKYGVLVQEGEFLKKIIEKPKERINGLVNIGMYKFTPEIFGKLKKIKKSPRGEYEITDVVTLLAEENKVKVKEIRGYWLDFGNPGDVIKISRFLNENFKSKKR
jgi:dTDP-glucose pyrophosphorylase